MAHQEVLRNAAIAYAFGPYVLNRQAHRLLRGQEHVPLTAKAFDTLDVLVRAAGKTVSKDELLKQVWPGTFVQEETLAQNISTIRKALGDPADSPRYVLTIPREGYRFVAPVEVVHLPEPARRHEAGAVAAQARSIGPWSRYVGVASAAVLLTAGAFVASSGVRQSAPDASVPPTTFEIFEPPSATFTTSGGALALSPDGRHLAFLASDADGSDHLWVRALDSLESTKLPGTIDASQPFWSADSRSLAFVSGGDLRRVDIAGGQPRRICEIPGPNTLAGTWGHRNLILFATAGKGMFSVAASGGTPAPIAVPGMNVCADCLWPSFLPDGRHFLFTVASATSSRGVYVGSLEGGPPVRVLDAVSSSAFTTDGYLLYASAGALVARRFDPAGGRVSGDVLPIADHVWYNQGTGRAAFSVSSVGLLAYREPLTTRLQWISRTGAVLFNGPEGVYHSFAAARDGRVLASQLDARVGTYDLLLLDPALARPTRLTFDPGSELRPLWSIDESHAVFVRAGDGWQVYEIDVNRPGVERALLPHAATAALYPLSWDGDTLEYVTYGRSTRSHLWRVRPGRDAEPVSIREQDAPALEGRVSPDGKWLAYTANLSDSRVPNAALFTRPWRGGSGRSEIAKGGSVPRWRSDGKELFFIAPGGKLMAQPIEDGRPAGTAVELCTTAALATSGLAGEAYAAAPDGQQFLIKVPARRASIVVTTDLRPRAER
jgi:DNA-binding winged helix-turn-helix (wHTH) protein/Tol biopolymer transport system component